MNGHFTCPCGRSWEIRQTGTFHEVTDRRERQRRARQVRRARNRERVDRLHSEAESMFPIPQTHAAPDLQPGEKAKIETPVRAPRIESDVAVPFLQALMYGSGAALMSAPLSFLPEVPWFTPLVVLTTVTGGAMIVTPTRTRKLLLKVEEWTGIDLDRDGQVGPFPPIPIKKPPERKDGRHMQYRYPQIPTPNAGYEMLARWFWRVVRQGGVGFSQGVAFTNYHIQRDECKAVQQVFIAEGWAVDKGGTQGVHPTDEGLDVMYAVIKEVYPTARLSPEGAEGA